nr:collagen alpha-1(I) chain-like [Anser cygnoides]
MCRAAAASFARTRNINQRSTSLPAAERGADGRTSRGTPAPAAASPAEAGLCRAGGINLAARRGAASVAGLAPGRAEPVGFADLARGSCLCFGHVGVKPSEGGQHGFPASRAAGDGGCAARVSFAAVPSPVDHLLILGLFVLKTFPAAGGRESLPLGSVPPRGQPVPLPAPGLWGFLHGVGRVSCSSTTPASAKSRGLSQPHHQSRVVTAAAQIPPGSSPAPSTNTGGVSGAAGRYPEPGPWDWGGPSCSQPRSLLRGDAFLSVLSQVQRGSGGAVWGLQHGAAPDPCRIWPSLRWEQRGCRRGGSALRKPAKAANAQGSCREELLLSIC